MTRLPANEYLVHVKNGGRVLSREPLRTKATRQQIEQGDLNPRIHDRIRNAGGDRANVFAKVPDDEAQTLGIKRGAKAFLGTWQRQGSGHMIHEAIGQQMPARKNAIQESDVPKIEP